MSIHLFCLPRKKVFKSASWNHLGNHVNLLLFIIVAYSESSTCQISLVCWVDSVFTFDFFFQYNNIFWFVSILLRHQTLKKAGLILFDSQSVLFRGVWWEFLFCVIHCTPEVYIYCNKLSVAHQGDRFTSCENIISCTQTLLLSPAFPGIYPVRVDDNVQPEGGCTLEK